MDIFIQKSLVSKLFLHRRHEQLYKLLGNNNFQTFLTKLDLFLIIVFFVFKYNTFVNIFVQKFFNFISQKRSLQNEE